MYSCGVGGDSAFAAAGKPTMAMTLASAHSASCRSAAVPDLPVLQRAQFNMSVSPRAVRSGISVLPFKLLVFWFVPSN
jgi:hypothetical protein